MNFIQFRLILKFALIYNLPYINAHAMRRCAHEDQGPKNQV